MKKLVVLVALVFCTALAGTAEAATVTGILQVTADVTAAGACTMSNGGTGFGTVIPPITANVDTLGWFGVTCPNGTPYTVALSAGGSGDFAQRQLTETTTPTDKVNYNAFTDATYATIWGDGTGVTATVPGIGTNAYQMISAFLRVPPQPTPPPGYYLDTMTITVTY